MNIVKYLGIALGVFLFFAFSNAFADTNPNCSVSVQGVSTEVQRQMQAVCEAATTTKVDKETVTIEQAMRWGEIASAFTKAIGEAAHQVGVGVNEFIASPAGKITVGIILWKSVAPLLFKLLAALVLWIAAHRIGRGLWTKQIVESEPRAGWFGRQIFVKTRVYYNWGDAQDSQVFSLFLLIVGTFIATAIIVKAF